MITIRQVSAEKAHTIRRIKAIVYPHMWESGYVTGPLGASRHVKLWIGSERPTFRINGLMVDVCEGVAEDGMIVDGGGGGLVTKDFRDIPLEDLLKIERWATKRFAQQA